MVWSVIPRRKVFWWWQTKFNVSPGPGLWSLVLGPFGPDLGPDLGPGPGPELDKNILRTIEVVSTIYLETVLEKL